MFEYFNRELFENRLPACLLNFSRKARTFGFFAPQRWQGGAEEVRHEISLNPSTLRSRRPIDVASTLVHEMVHLWQQDFGQPSRRGYHNAEWAQRMDEVGLVPSSTAAPGGARVGQLVSHYIATGGRFERAFEAMPSEYLLPWSCEEPEETKRQDDAQPEQGEIHLLGLRDERVGRAGAPHRLRGVRGGLRGAELGWRLGGRSLKI
jgi:hypothetical protein